MLKSLQLLFTLLTCLGLPIVPHATAQTTDSDSGWGAPSNGLQMRATVHRDIYRDSAILVTLEFRAVQEPGLDTVCLSTDVSGWTLGIRLTDINNGKSRLTKYRNGGRRYPSFDTTCCLAPGQELSHDSIRFESLGRAFPSALDVAGNVEFFVPPNDSGYWSGVLISEPVAFTALLPDSGYEQIMFLVPRQFRIVDGPRITYDDSSPDTISVRSRRGFYRFFISKRGGGTSIANLPHVVVDDTSDLPSDIPIVRDLMVIGEPGIFVDGVYKSSSSTWKVYEQIGGLGYHATEMFQTPHKLLWSDSASIVVNKRLWDSLTAVKAESYEHQSYMVPSHIHVGQNRFVTLEDSDLAPFECAIPRGHRLGYYIVYSYETIASGAGLPSDTIARLPDSTPPEADKQLVFCVCSFEPDSESARNGQLWHGAPTYWVGHVTLNRDTGDFTLEQRGATESDKKRETVWRTAYTPRSLRFNHDFSISYDTTDMHTIEYRSRTTSMPLYRLTVADHEPQIISSQLPQPLLTLTEDQVEQGTVEITLELILTDSEMRRDPMKAGALWSETYKMAAPERHQSQQESIE